MKKILILIFIFFVFASFAQAQPSPAQLKRVEATREMLKDVDKKSLEDTLKELKSSPYFEGSLTILEAVAATYREMVSEYQVEGQAKKEWLHSMVMLNMAYFQLGGSGEEEGESGLNIIIRRKLKKYLPAELMADRRLFHSLEQQKGE